MKNTTQFIVAALGVGMALLLLAGCHHPGGGCGYYAPESVPVAVATIPTNALPPVVLSSPSNYAPPSAPTAH